MTRASLFTLLCILLAFAASAVVSRSVFERLPHLEDEFAYVYQARIFERGDVYIPTPRPVRAYWQPFLISLGDKRFGKYTPGWPAVLAIGEGLDQPWIVSAWLAMITVALVYRLGREIYNPATGAVAALLTAASPAALLLNGTLMGHTAALCFAMLFIFALWRIERGRHALAWGAAGGAALGMLVLTRPLTGVGLAAPFVLYCAGRILWAGIKGSWRLLRPLLVLALAAILFGMLWPAFNYRVTAKAGESFPHYLVRFVRGDADTNLYLYIWKYDKAGFGPGHGRAEGGHTPKLGWKHAKQDLRCASRDLFGWAQPAPDGLSAEKAQAQRNECLMNGRGYSWLLLPLGFLLGAYRRWTWLLLLVPVSLVAIYITYWIGGELYSARYYFEALGAVAIVSAFGLTELARLVDRAYQRVRGPARLRPGWVLYGALFAVTAYSLAVYSPARINPLHGYGHIGQEQIAQVNGLRREPDRPLLVIVSGKHNWREIASLMAETTPYLDSDIVLARDPDQNTAPALIERFPGREVLYYSNGQFSNGPPPKVPGG